MISGFNGTPPQQGMTWVERHYSSALRSALCEIGESEATDHLLGIRLTGRMNRQSLGRLLRGLRPGITELMCHPGRYDQDLEHAPTRLKRERQAELEVLTDPEIRELLRVHGIELSSFRDQK